MPTVADKRGFTLVELLIVVAIIAILAAIAIPQFVQFKRKGYAATLNSDAQNAYNAAMAYMVDYPTATPSCSDLQSNGYKPSNSTSCSSDLSVFAGAVSITGPTAWGLVVSTATISYSGVLTSAR